MSVPEFSRRVPLDRLGSRAVEHPIEADSAERTALATRFGLLSLDSLSARLTARSEGSGARVEGVLEATLAQACVISGEPVPASLRVPVDLAFQPFDSETAEVELSADELDVLPLDGGAVDLGEAAAQALAVALDPYPRAHPDALAPWRTHLLDEETAERQAAGSKAAASPFAKLRPR